MRGIFIYFAPADKDVGRKVARFVSEQRSETIQWDPEADRLEPMPREVEKAVRKAGIVIVLWSRNCANLNRCRDVIRLADSKGTLVMMRLDSTRLPAGDVDEKRHPVLGLGDSNRLQMLLACRMSTRNATYHPPNPIIKALAQALEIFNLRGITNDIISVLARLFGKLVHLLLYRLRNKLIYATVVLLVFLIAKDRWEASIEMDTAAWQQAESANTVESYTKYLEAYLNGKFVRSAENAIASLRFEADYEKAKKADTLASYDEFLAEWPAASNVKSQDPTQNLRFKAKIAMEQIDEKEDAAWMAALHEDDINGYQAYLMDYPEGRHPGRHAGLLR